MWDTNLNNLMLEEMSEPTRFAYDMTETDGMKSSSSIVVTPLSKYRVKWMDSSSVVCFHMMTREEGVRAAASRLWLNTYIRRQYDVYPFCVPLSIVDWLNLLIGFEKRLLTSKHKHLLAYV